MLPAISDAPDGGDAADEARGELRSNLFVMATLSSPGGSGPVRIRNMSPGGALVEGSAIPPKGSPVRLIRGTLCVPGCIAWGAGGKAGLRFDFTIAVADWLANGIGAKGQHKIDKAVYDYKAGSRLVPQPRVGALSRDLNADDLAGDLLALKLRLQGAAEDLLDCATAPKEILALQLIDNMTQELGKLARTLALPKSQAS